MSSLSSQVDRWGLLFLGLLFSVTPALARPFKQLGKLNPQETTAIVGGTFYPPTLAHGKLAVDLMDVFGIASVEYLPTWPYKSAPISEERRATISASLTSLMIEHFDEVLDAYSVAHRGFGKTSGGQSQFHGRNGQRFSLRINRFDHTHHVKENTLHTLTSLKAKIGGGDPNKLLFVAGVDTLMKVHTWTPQWQEVFDQTNWIIFSRGDIEGAPDFEEQNPLAKIWNAHPDFLAQFTYRFDAENRVHIYEREGKPGIYILDRPGSNDSSTKHRESIRQDADHVHAELGLQPAVFHTCIKEQYFGDESRLAEGVFSRGNLERLAQHIKQKIERTGHPEAADIYLETAQQLVKTIENEIQAGTVRSQTIIAVAGHILIHVAEGLFELIKTLNPIGMPQRIRRFFSETLNEKFIEYALKFGKEGMVFVTIYLFVEVFLEKPIGAVLGYLLLGEAGAVGGASVFHHEPVTFPLYFGLLVLRLAIAKWRLASPHDFLGNRKLYGMLIRLRDRLLRGNADRIISRISFGRGMGIHRDAFRFNVVSSQLPNWMPLGVRQWLDRRTTWYDLNLSVNELANILGNPVLTQELKKSFEGKDNHGILADHLMAAILTLPEARYRLYLFGPHRYLNTIILGDVPPELLGGFSDNERQFIQNARTVAHQLRTSMEPAELKLFSEIASDAFAIARIIQMEPEAVRNTQFWETAIDLMVHRYPERKFDPHSRSQTQIVADRLPYLIDILAARIPSEGVRNLSISYGDRKLVEVSASGEVTVVAPHLKRRHERKNAIQRNHLKSALTHFFEQNKSLLERAIDLDAGQVHRPEFLPRLTRGVARDADNFLWDIHQTEASYEQEFSSVHGSSNRALVALDEIPQHPKARLVFVDARFEVLSQFQDASRKFLELQFEWLRLKMAHLFQKEAEIPGYREMVAKLDVMREEYQVLFERFRTLNHMMFGIEAVNLRDIEFLRQQVARLLELSPTDNVLGKSVFHKGAHVLHQAVWGCSKKEVAQTH